MKHIALYTSTTSYATSIFDNDGNESVADRQNSAFTNESNFTTDITTGAWVVPPDILYPIDDTDDIFHPFFAGSFAQISAQNHGLKVVFKFEGDIDGTVYAHLTIGHHGTGGYIANNWDNLSINQFDYCYANYRYSLALDTTVSPVLTTYGESIASSTHKNPSGLLKAAQKALKDFEPLNTTMTLTNVYTRFSGVPIGTSNNSPNSNGTPFEHIISNSSLAKASLVIIKPDFYFDDTDLISDPTDGQIRVKDDIYQQEIDQNISSRIQIF